MYMFRDRTPTQSYYTGAATGIGHGGFGNVGPVYTQQYYSYGYEWIDDVVDQAYEENFCDHYKVIQTVNPSIPLHYSTSVNHNGTGGCVEYTRTSKGPLWGKTSNVPSYDLRYGTYDQPLTGLPQMYVIDAVGRYSCVQPADIQSCIDASLTNMLPGIRPRLSVLNSLYELKDMKTLPATLKRVRSWYSLMKQWEHSFSKVTWNRMLRASVRTVSDIYLQGMFNLSPLYADIKATVASVHGIHEQIKSLLANQGKVQKRHFRRYLNESYPVVNESFSYSNAGTTGDGNATCKRVTQYTDPVFHATMRYSYRITDLERENALFRGYLDSMGVFINPRIVWAAIPWSFVVDWFVGVGPWLEHNFSMRNLEPITHIHSYIYSFKNHRTVKTFMSETDNPYGYNCVDVPICQADEYVYLRRPHNPDIYRSLRMSGLDLTEFSLSAALFGSRVGEMPGIHAPSIK